MVSRVPLLARANILTKDSGPGKMSCGTSGRGHVLG